MQTIRRSPYWSAVSQHWHYGDYPTTHVSANFGHGGTSNLFAFTSGHEVEVIEVVGDKVSVYAAKLNTTERRLVTLERIDANGERQLVTEQCTFTARERRCLSLFS